MGIFWQKRNTEQPTLVLLLLFSSYLSNPRNKTKQSSNIKYNICFKFPIVLRSSTSLYKIFLLLCGCECLHLVGFISVLWFYLDFNQHKYLQVKIHLKVLRKLSTHKSAHRFHCPETEKIRKSERFKKATCKITVMYSIL